MPQIDVRPHQFRSFSASLLLAACFSLLIPHSAFAGGGSSSSLPDVSSSTASPEENAQMHYKRGLKFRDKAWELEKKAARAQGGDTEKLMNKAQKEYGKAVKAQRDAVTANPRLHQAHSSLGYALRKTGDFDESIKSYDRALVIAPGYTEAIEYRAEAYLSLNRLDEAKNAYLTLMRADQARADELMTAMKKWLAENEGGSTQVSEADLEAFASWVEERADIAGHAAMLTPVRALDW